MFKNQHKGLFPLALSNTGERFGYYIMLATLVLYIQAKFGFDEGMAGTYYAWFLVGVYFLPVLGGWVADKIGFGKCVVIGQVLMLLGYLGMAIPAGVNGVGLPLMIASLVFISLGVGFFKGNLVNIFGNLYNDPMYAPKRESAFSLYYVFNNIGAMFAPAVATKVTQSYMAARGFVYNANVPSLAHQFLDGTINDDNLSLLQHFAEAMGQSDLTAFCTSYLEALTQSFNLGFAIAVGSVVVSLGIYFAFRSWFRHADYNGKAAQVAADNLTPKQTRDRIVALCMIFAVIIFFWMAFHQNGTALTYFARDYTQTSVSGWVRLSFNIGVLAMIAVAMFTLFGALNAESKKGKIICFAATAALVGGVVAIALHTGNGSREILPQEFQQFNPFLVIALTPISLAIFSGLAKKGKEPSAPMKIALGMVVAAVGYLVLVVCSVGLPDPATLNGRTCATPVVPQYLMTTYLVLTFAELLLSPMGLSFVSKVAPAKYKGLMMGCWFASGAVGNYLSKIPSMLWNKVPLWLNWTILMSLCVVSAIIMFSLLRKIEEATK